MEEIVSFELWFYRGLTHNGRRGTGAGGLMIIPSATNKKAKKMRWKRNETMYSQSPCQMAHLLQCGSTTERFHRILKEYHSQELSV